MQNLLTAWCNRINTDSGLVALSLGPVVQGQLNQTDVNAASRDLPYHLYFVTSAKPANESFGTPYSEPVTIAYHAYTTSGTTIDAIQTRYLALMDRWTAALGGGDVLMESKRQQDRPERVGTFNKLPVYRYVGSHLFTVERRYGA